MALQLVLVEVIDIQFLCSTDKIHKYERKTETPTYLHLGSPVLKPELHLSRLQVELPTEVQPLFLVRMRPFLEATITTKKYYSH